jgi:prephenate dehydrogenase
LAARRRLSAIVLGHDRLPASAGSALEIGAVDRTVDDLALLASADLIVVAVPIAFVRPVFEQLARAPGTAPVTDVGSVRRVVQPAGRDVLGTRFVGAHPMAGRERSGPLAAKADLFEGRPCHLFPSDDAAATDQVKAFWTGLGCNVRTDLDAAEHDRIMAAVSHLPHLLSAALARSGDEHRDHAGPGFEGMTRLAGGDPQLWADILLANADAIRAAGEVWQTRFDALLDAVVRQDRSATVDLLRTPAPPEGP